MESRSRCERRESGRKQREAECNEIKRESQGASEASLGNAIKPRSVKQSDHLDCRDAALMSSRTREKEEKDDEATVMMRRKGFPDASLSRRRTPHSDSLP